MGKRIGWLTARLKAEVSIPLEGPRVLSDADLRLRYGPQLQRQLMTEAIRSLMEDRLALFITLDGIEDRVG